MMYRLDLDRWIIGRDVDILFSADAHAACLVLGPDDECDRASVLIEQIDEEPGMPRRVRRP